MAEAKQNQGNEVQYDLEIGDAQETEVEIEDGKGFKVGSEEFAEPESSEDDSEHENYSASVQKRIDRLTRKMREAERQKDEALRYAQGVQSEAEQVRQRMKQLDQGYLNEYGGRLTLEQQQAESELKRAVEMGDADATVSASRKLTSLALSAQQYENAKYQQLARQQQEQAYAQYMAQNPAAAQQQQPKAQRPDPKAEDWASQNAWFGQDEAMTFAAFGIHKKLVESEGFDPQSDEYYSELDRRIRTEFPQKFSGSSNSRRPAQNVAGVSRSTTSSAGRRRVKLNPSQVAIAKKLGVPLEEYAKYVKE